MKDSSPQLFLPSQNMIWAKYWTAYLDTAVIARRRLGKTRFALQTAVLQMYYAVGLLPAMYPEFRSEKISAHMKLIQDNNEGRGVTFRATFFAPHQNQSHTLFTIALKEALSHVYHCLPVLAKHRISLTQATATIARGPHTATLTHKGIRRDAENQRGTGNELAIVDEIQDHDLESLQDVVWPTLRDNNGRRLILGTANAKPILRTIKKDYGEDAKRQLFIINIDQSIKNGDLTEADKTDILRDYNNDAKHPSYLREWMCLMNLPISGAILENWKPRIREHEEGNKIVLACDIGYHDPYACLAFSVSPDRRWSLIDGFSVKGRTTPEVVEMARDMLKRRKLPLPEIVVLPHDAFSQSTTSTYTDRDLWDNSGISPVIRRANKGKSKEGSISALVNMIHLVDRSADVPENVMTDLNNWSYDLENKLHPDRPKHDRHSHIGDAFEYGCVSIFNTINYLMPPTPQAKKDEHWASGLVPVGVMNNLKKMDDERQKALARAEFK